MSHQKRNRLQIGGGDFSVSKQLLAESLRISDPVESLLMLVQNMARHHMQLGPEPKVPSKNNMNSLDDRRLFSAAEAIVPFSMKFIVLNHHCGQFLVGDLDASLVGIVVQSRMNL